ncbi:hypothetical protein D9M69_583460 [compost metagenome]
MAVGNPFDIVVARDHTIELHAVALTEQQATAVTGQVVQLFEFHRMLAVDEQRHFFTQYRHRREQHALLPLRGAVGQYHIDPAFGGVQQAAFPVAQHDHLDFIPQLTEQVLHHAGRQATHLLAITPGDRRVHRVITIANLVRRDGMAGHQYRQQAKPSRHQLQAATLAVNR